jgi:GT2 family glycosyltransferase
MSVDTLTLTIAVPIKNRAFVLSEFLESILSQDYPKRRIQVLFVDGFSTDGTHERLLEWSERFRSEYLEIVLIEEESNIPKARNICLQHAQGAFILFWDSDVIAPPHAIKTLLGHLADLSVGIANLPYDVKKPSIVDVVQGFREPKDVSVVSSVVMGFTMVRRDLTEKVGFFNERLDGFEDLEYCQRVRKNGYKVLFDPSIRLLHIKQSQRGLRFFIEDTFRRRAGYIARLIESGYRAHLFKVAYYFFLPLVPIALVLTQLFKAELSIIFSLLLSVYVVSLVVYHLEKTQWNAKRCLLSLIVYVPGGIAMAYGVVWFYLKRLAQTSAVIQ